MGKTTYQLVQDISHQQYGYACVLWWKLSALGVRHYTRHGQFCPQEAFGTNLSQKTFQKLHTHNSWRVFAVPNLPPYVVRLCKWNLIIQLVESETSPWTNLYQSSDLLSGIVLWEFLVGSATRQLPASTFESPGMTGWDLTKTPRDPMKTR